MPMSPRLLRPIQNTHPEAADWANRVRTNGGSVSGSTLVAVSKFCRAIDAAGIRDRFYRLNLFCGTGLEACLVPLYRGASRTGTQYGNTTDTNNGPFVSGDYVETGASGGLRGNGTTKYLNTGVPMNFTNRRDYHLSAFAFSIQAGASPHLIGADTFGDGVSPRLFQGLVSFAQIAPAERLWIWYNFGTSPTGEATSVSNSYVPGLITGVGSASINNLYAGSSSVGSFGAAANETGTRTFPHYVFAGNVRNVSLDKVANARLGMYSIGLAMTASQVGALNSAMAVFNTALIRS